MKEPEVSISPETFQGWNLKYNPSHDGMSDYQAHRNSLFLSARTLPELLGKISKEEEIAVEFSQPIRVLIEHYGVKPAQIVRMLGNNYEYLDSDGKVDKSYLHQLGENQGGRDRTVFHDSRKNQSVMRRIGNIQKKITALYALRETLHKSMTRVSIPWLLMEAKRQGAVKANPSQAKVL